MEARGIVVSRRERIAAIFVIIIVAIACSARARAMYQLRHCRIAISNSIEQYVENATVRVRVLPTGPVLQPKYDGQGVFVLDSIPSGILEIEVTHRDYQSQTFRVAERNWSNVIQVRLGREGEAYEYFGDRRYAYQSRPSLIAVSVHRGAKELLLPLFDSLGLMPIDAAKPDVHILKSRIPLDRMRSPVLAALRRNPLVYCAGPIRVWTSDRFVGFGSSVIAVFRQGVPQAVRDSLLRHTGVNRAEEMGDRDRYRLEIDPEIGEGIVDIVRDLTKYQEILSARVEYF